MKLFRRIPRQHKDAILSKLYEAMAYSVLLVLAAAYPRRRDHFLEDQALKLHIINVCAEWTIGIQPRDLDEGHWIVKGESHGDRKHGVLPKAKVLPKFTSMPSSMCADLQVALIGHHS